MRVKCVELLLFSSGIKQRVMDQGARRIQQLYVSYRDSRYLTLRLFWNESMFKFLLSQPGLPIREMLSSATSRKLRPLITTVIANYIQSLGPILSMKR